MEALAAAWRHGRARRARRDPRRRALADRRRRRFFAPDLAPPDFSAGWRSPYLVVDLRRAACLGRRLTEECVTRARRDGAAVIALHTSPAMEAALALYLKLGFELERRVPDRFGVPYGVYLMDLQEDPAS